MPWNSHVGRSLAIDGFVPKAELAEVPIAEYIDVEFLG